MPENWPAVCRARAVGVSASGECRATGEDEAKGSKCRERNETHDPNRRDFLYVATGMAGVVGAAAVAWPFIDQMRPDASTLALATHRSRCLVAGARHVDDGQVARQAGVHPQPHAKEIEAAKDVPISRPEGSGRAQRQSAADAPATDVDRSAGEGKENWLVMVGVCTHLGCIPLGQAGEYDGWFCPCHGSVYDTAGRIRKGPAPENLAIPTFAFMSDTKHPDRLRQRGNIQ